jgi:hypothetical protein
MAKTDAERQRLRAARKKAGIAVLGIEVHYTSLVDALLDENVLAEWNENDRAEVIEAFSHVIHRWISTRSRVRG